MILLLVPTYSNGMTLLQMSGTGVFLLLLFPMLLTLMPIINPDLRKLAIILMILWVLGTFTSVGRFYIPSAMAMLWPKKG